MEDNIHALRESPSAAAETYQRSFARRSSLTSVINCPSISANLERSLSVALSFFKALPAGLQPDASSIPDRRRIERAKELLSSSGRSLTTYASRSASKALALAVCSTTRRPPPITFRAIVVERRIERQRKVPACF